MNLYMSNLENEISKSNINLINLLEKNKPITKFVYFIDYHNRNFVLEPNHLLRSVNLIIEKNNGDNIDIHELNFLMVFSLGNFRSIKQSASNGYLKKIITNEHEIENQKTLELNIFDFNLIDFPTGIYNRTYIHTYFDSKYFNVKNR